MITGSTVFNLIQSRLRMLFDDFYAYESMKFINESSNFKRKNIKMKQKKEDFLLIFTPNFIIIKKMKNIACQ